MKKCIIVGASTSISLPEKINQDDLVLLCDGGYKNYPLDWRKPDAIIGDFDSLGFIPKEKNTIILPREKDDTDVFYAVKYGIDKGCQEFELYSCLGGEFDHSFGNVQILNFLKEKGLNGTLFGNELNIELIKNEKRIFDNKTGIISIFSYTIESSGVSIKNLKYEMNNGVLRNDYPIGIRNEFINKKAEIEVKNGTCILIYYKNGERNEN